MDVSAEPFLTRDSVLLVLRPGELTSDRPFRTLRQREAASGGLPVTMRTSGGHVLGRFYLYGALNLDAARAFRLHRLDLAQQLAARATEMERSTEARVVHEAVAARAARLPADPSSKDAPAELRRYLRLRRRSSWRGLDTGGLMREWLAGSGAWMSEKRLDLVDAARALDRSAERARADILGEASTATTFFGVVQRMDSTAAEIEADDGQALLVPRDELERQGLATLGQAVALLREKLPGGGSYSLAMSAVALEPPRPAPADPVWDTEFPSDGGIREVASSSRDMAWLERELAREPRAVPAAALPMM